MTAGALWTPMWSDAQASDENVQAIITQIRYAVQGGGGGGGGGSGDDGGNDTDDSANDGEDECEGDEELFSLSDMREELERLRNEVANKTRPDRAELRGGGGGGLCPLPAAVPDCPTGLRVTDQMNVLCDTVISEESRSRVGFWGAGGIGKTT